MTKKNTFQTMLIVTNSSFSGRPCFIYEIYANCLLILLLMCIHIHINIRQRIITTTKVARKRKTNTITLFYMYTRIEPEYIAEYYTYYFYRHKHFLTFLQCAIRDTRVLMQAPIIIIIINVLFIDNRLNAFSVYGWAQ